MIKVEMVKALMLKAIPGFIGVAYDGFWFYLTVKGEHRIIKTDVYFMQAQYFKTVRCYSHICYDGTEDCLWAIDRYDSSYVFKLNDSFEEIDALSILAPEGKERKITGISYNYCSDNLIIAFEDSIMSVNKHSSMVDTILDNVSQYKIAGVADILSCYLCYGILKPKNEIYAYSKFGRFITKFYLPNNLKLNAMVLVPKEGNYNQFHLYFLATSEEEEQYILIYLIEDDILEQGEEQSSEFIELIALEGVKIAYMLNVEGVRYKKVIASTSDKREIEVAHNSICSALDQAASKEQLLYSMLEKLVKLP